MNKVRIENLNIKYDQDYYRIDEAIKILRRREDSILTKKWFMLKMKDNDLIPLYDNNSHVFVYVDKHDSMCGLHFYNSYGDLIMTYPWNGKMSLLNEGQMVNDYKDRFGNSSESRLKAVNVAYRNGEIIVCDEIGASRYQELSSACKHDLRVFNYEGNENKCQSTLLTRRAKELQIEMIIQAPSYQVDGKLMAMRNTEQEDKIINY